jgi:hypothetical protein
VFSSRYLCVQGVQSLIPQCPVPVEPFIDLRERLGTETVDPPLRVLPNVDQACFPQDSQVA